MLAISESVIQGCCVLHHDDQLQLTINRQFREFAAALLAPEHSLSLDQQSVIHCLIICAIQLSTPNNSGGT